MPQKPSPHALARGGYIVPSIAVLESPIVCGIPEVHETKASTVGRCPIQGRRNRKGERFDIEHLGRDSQSWIRGIGAFNGVGIPAAQNLWPDATVGQMNRISDFGFQVNKVIAKQSSDIVVAFFPIDRFLTPELASLFVSSPSAFFVPFAAIKDPKVKDRLKPYKIWNPEDEANLIKYLTSFLPPPSSWLRFPLNQNALIAASIYRLDRMELAG